MTTPKNVHSYTPEIITLSILIRIIESQISLFENIMKLVFARFNDNLLILNHVFIFNNSSFIYLHNSTISVSSAKRTYLRIIETLQRSFIYEIKGI